MKKRLKLLWNLFFVFLKIGPVTFGGGFAMIPILEREVVTKHKWIDEDELSDLVTIAQTIPGAVAVNSAIFIGHRLSGILGAIFAMLGIVLPTLVIVMTVILFYQSFYDHSVVKAAFNGIGASVTAFILHAGYKVGKGSIKDRTMLFIAFLTIIILLYFHLNPIYLILSGVILGIGFSRLKTKRRRKKSENTTVTYKDIH